MYAIKSLTKLPFRRSGVTFSPDFWTLVENPTEDQMNEPNLEIIEVSGTDDPALTGALAASDQPTSSEVENLHKRIQDLEERAAPSVRISIDASGLAHIDAPDDVEVSFVYVEDLPSGDRLVDLAALMPQEGAEEANETGESEEQEKPTSQAQPDPFAGLSGLGEELKSALAAAGIQDVAAMRAASDEALLAISGIGAKKLGDLRSQLAALG